MAEGITSYNRLHKEMETAHAVLVAVSKTKSAEAIMKLYEQGQRDFGENYVQELVEKQAVLPNDIRWHFIGHLQSNKVKYLSSFIHLVQSVDSEKLLKEINKQALKAGRVIAVLLQVHIAREETKFGFDEKELRDLLSGYVGDQFPGVLLKGLMGMASFSNDKAQVSREFAQLKQLYEDCRKQYAAAAAFNVLSMGMSGDYPLALAAGSTMVRIGSLLFGARQ